MDEKYTPEGLPILTPQTFKAYISDLDKNTKGGNAMLKEWFDGIQDKLVRSYIVNTTSRYPLEYQTSILAHLTGLYKLLQSQGNNYKINQYWGFDDSENPK
jgi:hypothetical protein